MTTPTSEPTRDEQRNALYESRGWEERSNDHVRMDDLADEIIRLRTALANAEREREAANDRAHNADVIIGNVSTILNAHDRLLTVESAARELVSERDALQRTVAGMEGLIQAAKAWAALQDDDMNPEHTLVVWAEADRRLFENVKALTTHTREESV